MTHVTGFLPLNLTKILPFSGRKKLTSRLCWQSSQFYVKINSFCYQPIRIYQHCTEQIQSSSFIWKYKIRKTRSSILKNSLNPVLRSTVIHSILCLPNNSDSWEGHKGKKSFILKKGSGNHHSMTMKWLLSRWFIIRSWARVWEKTKYRKLIYNTINLFHAQ